MNNMSTQYHKENWVTKDYHLHIDDATPSKIKGWLVNKSKKKYSLAITTDHSTEFISNTIHRPNLHKFFPSINEVNQSGFEFSIEHINDNVQVVLQYKNKVIKILSFVKPKKLLYVHIAKTAGTTVNNFLTTIVDQQNCLIHAESQPDWHEQVGNSDIHFISGHIPYRRFISCEEINNNFKKAITFREPYSHIISHLSWVRALAQPKNKDRFDRHPKYIQVLSQKLNQCDFTCPQSIRQMISSLRGPEFLLFDNTQTRYIRTKIAKPSVDDNDVSDAIINLKAFDFIGHDADIDRFLITLAKYYQSEITYNSSRSNVHNEKFGLDISNKAIRKALYPLVKYDLSLYEHVLKQLSN